jgi:beta-glucosidase
VALAAGESKTVEVAIDPAAFTVVNDAGEKIPGSGNWTLYAGVGQPDARTEELTGKKAMSVKL